MQRSASVADPTATAMSTTGFASKLGTEVLPTCSM